MPKENKVLLEKLFELVKSMSRSERTGFEADLALSSKIALRNSSIELFKLFSRQKSYPRKNLIPQIAKDEKALYDSTRFLISKIFEWIAIQNHRGRWELSMISQMIEKGFFLHAQSVLKKQARIAFQQADLYYLNSLFEVGERLSENHGLVVEYSKAIPTPQKVNEELAVYFNAKKLYYTFKKAYVKPFGQRLEIAKEFKNTIASLAISGVLPITAFWVLKAKSLWYFLQKEYREGSKCRQVLFNIISSNPSSFPVEEHVNEYAFNIPFLLFEGLFEDAEKVIYSIGTLETNNSNTGHKIISSWVYCSLAYSAYTGKTELGQRALQELALIEDTYSPPRRSFVLHCGAISKVYLGDWEGVFSLHNGIQKLGNKAIPSIRACSYLIAAIADFELGDYISSKKNLQKFSSQTKGLNLAYPEKVTSFLYRMMEARDNRQQTSFILSQFENHLSKLRGDENEDYLISPFDIGSWVASQKTGRSISSIIIEKNAPSLMRLKLIS